MSDSKDYKINFPPFVLKNPSKTQAIVDQIIERIDTGPGTIWNPISHFYNLYELAFGLHNNPETEGHIVEFGSYRGASACVMGQAKKDAGKYDTPIFAVDPYYKSHSGLFDSAYVIARENYHRFKLSNYVSPIICPIICPCLTFLEFWDLPIRLAYLDAGHRYQDTKEEIAAILPHIVPDGWLVCDDYADADGTKVMPALDDFLNEQKQYNLEVFQDKNQAYVHVKSCEIPSK